MNYWLTRRGGSLPLFGVRIGGRFRNLHKCAEGRSAFILDLGLVPVDLSTRDGWGRGSWGGLELLLFLDGLKGLEDLAALLKGSVISVLLQGLDHLLGRYMSVRHGAEVITGDDLRVGNVFHLHGGFRTLERFLYFPCLRGCELRLSFDEPNLSFKLWGEGTFFGAWSCSSQFLFANPGCLDTNGRVLYGSFRGSSAGFGRRSLGDPSGKRRGDPLAFCGGLTGGFGRIPCGSLWGFRERAWRFLTGTKVSAIGSEVESVELAIELRRGGSERAVGDCGGLHMDGIKTRCT